MTKQTKNYRIEKTYFRNSLRFGRTTTLLLDGVVVLVLMGALPKYLAVAQYEGTLNAEVRGTLQADDTIR